MTMFRYPCIATEMLRKYRYEVVVLLSAELFCLLSDGREGDKKNNTCTDIPLMPDDSNYRETQSSNEKERLDSFIKKHHSTGRLISCGNLRSYGEDKQKFVPLLCPPLARHGSDDAATGIVGA